MNAAEASDLDEVAALPAQRTAETTGAADPQEKTEGVPEEVSEDGAGPAVPDAAETAMAEDQQDEEDDPEPDPIEADADEPDPDEADEPVFAAVVRPEVVVRWPTGVVAALSRMPRADLDRPIGALLGLADALGTMFPEAGPGSLLPDGVRWSPSHGWQLLLTPSYDTSGAHYLAAGPFDEPAFAVAWRRDQQSVAIALIESAFGRRPADPAEIRRLADLTAGDLPHGFDATVNLLLREHVRPGDTTPLRLLAEALGRRRPDRVAGRCYLESGVGSNKARGRGELDNEDVAAAAVDASGGVRLALFDGATGDGDGSGRVAAVTARDAVVGSWTTDADPVELVALADAAVSVATPGCSTAVVAIVDASGRGRLASVGDSSAWLVRQGVRDGRAARDGRNGQDLFHAWRLTPTDTVFAESLRSSSGRTSGYSELTRYLGGGADDVFVTTFAVCEGDLLVTVSDGASVTQRGEWFGDVLRGLAAERADADRPLGAGLAAELVARAERCGGFDNATALVAEFSTPGY